MIDAVQILWSPAGVTLSALDPLELVDVTDGDTPNVRLPVRLLSVDTPEVTARTDQRAKAIDQEFVQPSRPVHHLPLGPRRARPPVAVGGGQRRRFCAAGDLGEPRDAAGL